MIEQVQITLSRENSSPLSKSDLTYALACLIGMTSLTDEFDDIETELEIGVILHVDITKSDDEELNDDPMSVGRDSITGNN